MDSVSASQPTRRIISPRKGVFVEDAIVETPKSVAFSEPDLDDTGNPNSPRVGRRPTRSSSSGSSSMRRASQVIEAVTETVQEATRTWTQFLRKWGPTILLLFLFVPSVYMYRLAADDIMYTVSKLRDTAIHQFDAAVAEFRNRQNQHAINADMKLNFTASIQPFWGEYAEMLRNTDYEHWFVNARDADDAITAMYNGLPPAAANETRRRTEIKGFVDLRSTQRKKAEIFFENFLAGRLATIETMMAEARTFRAWLSWKLSNGERPTKAALAEYALEPSVGDKQNMTLYVLNHAATKFMKKLITAHEDLFVTRDMSATHHGLSPQNDPRPGWERRLDALQAIEWAEETESNCIKYLRQNSANAEIWKDHHSGALRRLKRKLLSLQRQLNKIEAGMEWLVARFDSEIKFENNRTAGANPADKPDRLIWIEDVDGLLRSLEDVSSPLAEAYVWARRRHDVLRADIESFDYEKNWQRWKKNNCGFASCYEEAPDGAVGRLVTQAQQHLGFGGKPLAKRPLGLNESKEDALWEKTCCGESKHNVWVDLLKYGKEITYQHPHRVEQQAVGAAEDDGDKKVKGSKI